MTIARSAHPQLRPDPVRIACISGALLAHACVLSLLLVPLARPQWGAVDPPRVVEADWIVPRPAPPPPPPPQPQPIDIDAVQPRRPQPPATAAAPVDAAPAAVEPVSAFPPLPDPGPPTPTSTAGIGASATPAAGVRLRYAHATPPPYPVPAVRRGLEGSVVLRVLVDVDGRPLQVEIHAGSGHRMLDEAARRHVLRQWRFQPALRDGRPVRAVGLVPVDFRLDRA